MQISNLLRKVTDFYWAVLTTIVTISFAAMLIVMAIQILSRYVVGQGVPWTDEASRYLFLSSIFLGSVLALRTKEHISIHVVTERLPFQLRNIVAIIADILSLIILSVVAVGSWLMMEKTAGVMASTFQLSFSFVYMMQMISVTLMALYLFADVMLRVFGKAAEDIPLPGASL